MTDITQLDENGLEAVLSQPSNAAREIISNLPGDIIVLGAGGKMGPTLAMLLKKAAPQKQVHAVSRFSIQAVRKRLNNTGIKTIQADLLKAEEYKHLPHVDNVYYLAGMKFGASDNQPLTWAANTHIPALVCSHYRNSRVVVFSTGNVYPFYPIDSSGPHEAIPPDPVGEYAQSCLGRERMFQYFSEYFQIPVTIVRLNYANEPRYGIIVDVAGKIMRGEAIDLTVGAVNLIWQRDANDYIARSITLADSPAAILNVAGVETVQIRVLAEMIGKIVGRNPIYTCTEGKTALLSDASKCVNLFGKPEIPLSEMIEMILSWLKAGKPVLNKPTKYDVIDGKF